MIKALVGKKFENVFLLSILLLSSMYVLRLAYNYPFPHFNLVLFAFRFTSYFLVIIAFCYNIFNGVYTKQNIFFIFLLGIYLLYVSLKTRIFGFLTYYIYIVVGKDFDYKKIITAAFFGITFSVTMILVLCYLGIIEDHIFSLNSRNRHALGFNWTNNFSNLLMYIVFYLIYIKKARFGIKEMLILIPLNIFGFVMTDTKSSFFYTTLSIISVLILNLSAKYRKFTTAYNILLLSAPIIFSSMVILLSFFYNPNILFMSRLNSILSGRLGLGHKAILNYGLSLFPKHIIFIGGEPSDLSLYNFVDSSFLYILINFGAIFYFLIISLLEYFAINIITKKDIYLSLIFLVIVFHSVFDHELLDLAFNYFLFIWSYKNHKVDV